MLVEKEYTKISIDKDLHTLIKNICTKEGLKMYFFENEAIKKFVREKYSHYISDKNKEMFQNS